MAARVVFVYGPALNVRKLAQLLKAADAVTGMQLTRSELWARIDSGALRDSFTVQALALYERHQAARESSRS